MVAKLIIILVLLSSFANAEILNLCESIPRDEFIEAAKNVSKDGIIHAALNNGEPVIEGTFKSNLTPHIIAGFYTSYLKSKGIKTKVNKLSDMLNSEKAYPKATKLLNSPNGKLFKKLIELVPVWQWSGEINGEKKSIIVFNMSAEKGINSILKVSSFKKEASFINRFKPIKLSHPEFQNSQANLVLSREVFQRKDSSALFLYSAAGTPEIAVRNMKLSLEMTGWKDRLKNKQSKSDQSIYMMHKGDMNAMLVGTKREGETSLLVTISRFPAKTTLE